METDYTDQLDYGNFDDRAVGSLTWRMDDWRVRWTTKYKSSVADTNERLDDWAERSARNDERCASGSSSCVMNPETPLYLYYPSYTRHDISASYSMRTEKLGQVRMFAGVKNIFDDISGGNFPEPAFGPDDQSMRQYRRGDAFHVVGSDEVVVSYRRDRLPGAEQTDRCPWAAS